MESYLTWHCIEVEVVKTLILFQKCFEIVQIRDTFCLSDVLVEPFWVKITMCTIQISKWFFFSKLQRLTLPVRTDRYLNPLAQNFWHQRTFFWVNHFFSGSKQTFWDWPIFYTSNPYMFAKPPNYLAYVSRQCTKCTGCIAKANLFILIQSMLLTSEIV